MALLQRWQPRQWMERLGPREDWLTPLEDMRRTIDRTFDDFFRRGAPERPGEEEAWAPCVDVYEEGNEVVIRAEAPGVAKEDLTVTVADGVVTVRGEMRKEEKVEEKGYFRQELYCGSFHREIPLPADVREDEAKATFKDGVLEVRLPKTEEAEVKGHKIDIS